METILCKLHEHGAIFRHRSRSKAVLFGGGLFLIFLIKKLHRLLMIQRLKKKVQERREKRQEEIQALKEKLSSDGLTVDLRNEIINMSLKELQQRLHSGDLNAEIALKAYQSRAIEVHQTTNCIVGLVEEAQSLAEELDKSHSRNLPLHGVPISVKENYCLAGYDSTAGMACLLGQQSQEDAVIVKVLKAQGAIPFVRTNIPHTMMSYQCSNPIYGVTLNPLDLSRCPGGSSGGEGCLLAAEGSVLGFGSDIGGSVRLPGHMCGIYGLKTTSGRLSSKGLFGLSKGQNLVQTAAGPMARDVDSLVIAMKALLTPLMFDLDPMVPPLTFNNEVYQSSRPLRIGYYVELDVIQSVPACQRAVHLAKQVLEREGHTLILFDPPSVQDSFVLYISALVGDGGRSFSQYLEKDLKDVASDGFSSLVCLPRKMQQFLSLIMRFLDPTLGRLLWKFSTLDSVSKWWQLTQEFEAYRTLFIQKWRDLDLDAVICPGFAFPAAPTGFPAEAQGAVIYCALYNVLNFTAGTVPVTKVTAKDEEDMKYYQPRVRFEHGIKKGMVGSTGLPVNVQCVGLPYQEELVLRVMKTLESGLANQSNLHH